MRDLAPLYAYDGTIKAKEGRVMLLYLGWVVAAFLGGFLVACWHRKKQPDLAKRFSRIIRYRGIRYAEIVEAVGIAPQWESRKANGQIVRTWSNSRYSITLLFDEADICLGVEDEQIDTQKCESPLTRTFKR